MIYAINNCYVEDLFLSTLGAPTPFLEHPGFVRRRASGRARARPELRRTSGPALHRRASNWAGPGPGPEK